jgi:hypothetical protein
MKSRDIRHKTLSVFTEIKRLLLMPPSEAPLKIDIQLLMALEAMGSDRVSATFSVRMGARMIQDWHCAISFGESSVCLTH